VGDAIIPVEWPATAVLLGDQLLVLGAAHPLGEAHDCDAMGCGSVGDHVLVRPPPRSVADHVRDTIPHADVASDRDLLRKALLALRPSPGETAPRWSLVRSALSHGSTVGHHICVALGIDPDEEVVSKLPEWVTESLEDTDTDADTDEEGHHG
jgi:hypothetical protein